MMMWWFGNDDFEFAADKSTPTTRTPFQLHCMRSNWATHNSFITSFTSSLNIIIRPRRPHQLSIIQNGHHLQRQTHSFEQDSCSTRRQTKRIKYEHEQERIIDWNETPSPYRLRSTDVPIYTAIPLHLCSRGQAAPSQG